MHPLRQINYVKKQIEQKNKVIYPAYQQLLNSVESLSTVKGHAISTFSVPGFYQKKEMHRLLAKNLQIDASAAYSLALAYILSGDKKYAKKSIELLNNWAYTNKKVEEFDGD